MRFDEEGGPLDSSLPSHFPIEQHVVLESCNSRSNKSRSNTVIISEGQIMWLIQVCGGELKPHTFVKSDDDSRVEDVTINHYKLQHRWRSELNIQDGLMKTSKNTFDSMSGLL